MTISFHLEDELQKQLTRDMGDLNTAAREALLIQAYRMGTLSIGRLASVLGVAVVDADAWLAERGVSTNYSAADFDTDLQTLRGLRGAPHS